MAWLLPRWLNRILKPTAKAPFNDLKNSILWIMELRIYEACSHICKSQITKSQYNRLEFLLTFRKSADAHYNMISSADFAKINSFMLLRHQIFYKCRNFILCAWFRRQTNNEVCNLCIWFIFSIDGAYFLYMGLLLQIRHLYYTFCG